jgi:hypothetical protein
VNKRFTIKLQIFSQLVAYVKFHNNIFIFFLIFVNKLPSSFPVLTVRINVDIFSSVYISPSVYRWTDISTITTCGDNRPTAPHLVNGEVRELMTTQLNFCFCSLSTGYQLMKAVDDGRVNLWSDARSGNARFYSNMRWLARMTLMASVGFSKQLNWTNELCQVCLM